MEEVPEELTCPISHDIMADPVTTMCGHTFERESITAWFRTRSTCPCDNTHLASKHLSPNFALKHAIAAYVQHRPVLAMKQQQEIDFALAVQLREEFLQAQQEKHPLSSASLSSDDRDREMANLKGEVIDLKDDMQKMKCQLDHVSDLVEKLTPPRNLPSFQRRKPGDARNDAVIWSESWSCLVLVFDFLLVLDLILILVLVLVLVLVLDVCLCPFLCLRVCL